MFQVLEFKTEAIFERLQSLNRFKGGKGKHFATYTLQDIETIVDRYRANEISRGPFELRKEECALRTIDASFRAALALVLDGTVPVEKVKALPGWQNL